jgi:uncharacterized protein
MPVLPTYPGVYLEERPSGAHPISPVSTSVTAFVGAARMGPSTGKPPRVKNLADYVRLFGPPWDAAHPMGHTVAHFFANGGSEAFIVRVAASDAAAATADLKRGAASMLGLTAGTTGAWATSAGGAGLEAKVDYKRSSNPNDRMNLIITLRALDPRTGALSDVIQETWTDLSMDSTHPQFAVNTLGGSALVKAALPNPAPTTTDKGFSRSKALFASVTPTATAKRSFRLAVDGNQPVEVSLAAGALDPTTIVAALTAALTAAGVTGVTPTLDTVNGVANFIKLESQTQGAKSAVVITPAAAGDATRDLGLGLAAGGTEASGAASLRPDEGVATFGSGTDGSALTGNDFVSSTGSGGMYRLGDLDFPRFNLLCLPGLDVLANNEDLARALAYCGKEHAFLLVDTPVGTWQTDPPDIGGLPAQGQHGAIFYPRLLEVDPTTGADLNLPPCGAVAGVFARTDVARGVWKAPAGMEAGITPSRLTKPTSDDLSGVLNPRGVNVLRTFRGAGTVIWGARTLKGDDTQASEFKYGPIRRLTDMIESSLYLGTQFAVFEPNDPTLWQVLRLNVTAFMRGLFRQGAFAQSEDRSEAKSFFVICDESVNPPSEVDLGRVHVIVGFAPLKPAEFVIITITQIARLEG